MVETRKALSNLLRYGISMERNASRTSLEYYESVDGHKKVHTLSKSQVLGYSTDTRLAD